MKLWGMVSRGNGLSREALLLLVTALLALLALALAAGYVAQKHAWARQTLEDVEPRYERLAGVLRAQDQLQRSHAAALTLLEAYAYPASREAGQVATDAQQRLNSAFRDASLNLLSSQILPAREDGSLQLIPISVRAEGDLDALRKALVALAEHQPLIRLESIVVQRGRKGNQETAVRLNIQATFAVWRRLS